MTHNFISKRKIKIVFLGYTLDKKKEYKNESLKRKIRTSKFETELIRFKIKN